MAVICPYCNRQNEEGATFCAYCGKAWNTGAAPAGAPVKKKGSYKKEILISLLATAVLLAVGVGVYLFVIKSTTEVDLMENISAEDITFYGVNGYGTTSVDYDGVIDKIEYDKKKAAVKDFLFTVTYEVSPCDRLRNGDEITVTAYYSKEKAKEEGIKVKAESRTFKVSGLLESDYVGTWKVTSIISEGTTIAWEEAYGEVLLEVNGYLEVAMTTGGEPDGTGTWTEKDGKLVITDDVDGTELVGEVKDGALYMEIDNIMFTFQKI